MSYRQVCVEYESLGYVLLLVPWELIRLRVCQGMLLSRLKKMLGPRQKWEGIHGPQCLRTLVLRLERASPPMRRGWEPCFWFSLATITTSQP